MKLILFLSKYSSGYDDLETLIVQAADSRQRGLHQVVQQYPQFTPRGIMRGILGTVYSIDTRFSFDMLCPWHG